mmetsp:Transcript_54428/g.127272  ORF Transcript_54428/g.127272 Transcript_54428/m.127272 type:complete len:365 (+) Transcript_54428:16-1110(+)
MAARRFRLKYPPATAVALEDDMFVVGGGGGTSKSGIPNRVSLLEDSGSELKEVSHIDFKLDRVVGLCSHPKNRVVVCTTAGGFTHTIAYSTTNKSLSLLSSQSTAAVPEGEEYSPSQRAVSYSPSGAQIAISQGRSVGLWKSAKATGLVKVSAVDCTEQHKADVRDLLFTPDGSGLFTLDDEGCCLWDVASLSLKHRFSAKEDVKDVTAPKFRGVSLDAPAGLLYTLVSHAARNGSAGYITTRKITDEGLTVVRSAKVVPNAATALGAVKGGRFCVATSEGEVVVIDPLSLKPLATLTLHALPVTKVLMLEDGDTLSVSLDSYCCLGLAKAEALRLVRKERMIYAILFLIFFVALFLAYMLDKL